MAVPKLNICSWGYAILLSKLFLTVLESGIAKSFGVLIPMMVYRFDSDYATVGLISSMSATLIYLFFPFVTLILQKFSRRSVAMAGGLLGGCCIFACAFMRSSAALGVCLALSGVGFSMTMITSTLALNEYFPQNILFMNTITLYGYNVGSMLLPIITERAVEAYGYTGAFIILGGISFNTIICGATFRKAPTNVITNAQGRHKHGEDGEREALIQGEASQMNEMKNDNGKDEERILERRDAIQSMTNVQSNNEDVQTEKGKDKYMRQEGYGIPDSPPLSKDLYPQIEIDNEDPKNSREGQRYLIQNKTHKNDIPCDLPGETSPTNSLLSSFLRTCSQSCGILNETLFLFSLPVHLLVNYSFIAWMLFLVPHAEHLGIPQSQAVFLSSIGGAGGIIGRTIFIILVGKGINVLTVYITIGIICTMSFLLDFIASTYEVLAILAFSQGFCFFIEDTMMIALCKSLVFDETNFDAAYTIGGFLVGVGATCSGLFTGYLFDVTQSFTKVFIIIGITHVVAVVNLVLITILLKKRKKALP